MSALLPVHNNYVCTDERCDDPSHQETTLLRRLRAGGYLPRNSIAGSESTESSPQPTSVSSVEHFGVWDTIGLVIGWEEANRRLQTESSSLGIIATLVFGASLSSFFNLPGDMLTADPPEDGIGIQRNTLMLVYTFSMGASVVFSLVCVLLSSTAVLHSNLCINDEDFRLFLVSWDPKIKFVFCSCLLSIVSVLPALWAVLAIRCSLTSLVVFTVFIVILVVYTGWAWTHVRAFTTVPRLYKNEAELVAAVKKALTKRVKDAES
eukprot:EG_transcript_20183